MIPPSKANQVNDEKEKPNKQNKKVHVPYHAAREKL
jgi:hypothetical protein